MKKTLVSLLAVSLMACGSDVNRVERFEMENPSPERVENEDRVAAAQRDVGKQVDALLSRNGLALGNFELYLRAFKMEDELEVWARKRGAEKFELIHTYRVCAKSGALGPKRVQGDRQVPEGFYHIDRFNPKSKYHLSLGVNYPNKSDRILGVKDNLGGDIFIHGDCVTIGCLPITDDKIKELYLLCLNAKNSGQERIPVTIFPMNMSETKWQFLQQDFHTKPEYLRLWRDLKTAYDLFEQNRTLPTISFLEDGYHQVTP